MTTSDPIRSRPGVWRWVVSCFSCLFVPFVIQTLHAVQPYQPTHPDPVLEPWRWRTFPELKGLGLRCMAEDKDGSMWFGVDDGVRRYDGVTWTPYTEADGILGAPVGTLCATKDGSLYAGTALGISRFRDGAWRRVFPPEGDLPWPVTDLMEASDGSLWAGTEWGALRLFRGEAVIYTTEEIGAALRVLAPGVSLSVVPDGAAPARSWGEGVGIEVLTSSSLSSTTTLQVIRALAPGGPGEAAGLKVGDRITAVDGQSEVTRRRLNGPAGTSLTLTVRREGLPEPFEVTVTRQEVEGTYYDFRVYDVYGDRGGVVWFGLSRGVEGGEIVRYDPRFKPGASSSAAPETAWRLYTEEDGLEIGGGPRIAQTRDGVIWTVSSNGFRGVNRFDGKTWTHFRLRTLGGNNLNTSILETGDGTVWISGYEQLHAFRDAAWRVYRSPEVSVSLHRAQLLEASDGALWVAGVGQEAARLDYRTNRWTTYEGLHFEDETPDGAQWFISWRDSSIVRYDPRFKPGAGSSAASEPALSETKGQGGMTQSPGQAWTRYGVEDGVMDDPWILIATREGDLWAAGRHDSTAATARFDPSASSGQGGTKWSLQTHPQLSSSIHPWGIYESADGGVWFSAWVGIFQERGQLGGLLRFNGKTWDHYTPPEAPRAAYGIGQTGDGVLWFGGGRLRRFDGQAWTEVTEPEELTSWVHGIAVADDGSLWVSTRFYGVLRFDGTTWTRYDVRDGLANNTVSQILQTADGSIWAVTDKGASRFDGRAWTTYALPTDLISGPLRQSRDGALWINGPLRGQRRTMTIRYEPDADPPETAITLSLSEVSQPGNTTLAWRGADPWRSTSDEDLQFSWRLDGGVWSAFSLEVNRIFEALPSGGHTFEVKARDRDFNEDPTPAVVQFTVIPPVWQQPWFIVLMVGLLGAIGFQTGRVVRRDRRLRESNTALSGANKELFEANVQIQEANRLKSEFLANMSHELRTPMNAIIGFTRLVMRRGAKELSDRSRENLEKVKLSADHLLGLINGILDLSKIEAGRLDVHAGSFDVKGLVNACCATVGPLVKEGVALNCEVSDGVAEANTDEVRLRQILINLLSNAAKFTDEGEIQVRVSLDGGADGKGSIVISVVDTGIGIPEDSLETIFDEFRQVDGSHTRKHQGTGLGLSITKRLAELLGGTISVESEIGKGSTFTVKVPVVYGGGEG